MYIKNLSAREMKASNEPFVKLLDNYNVEYAIPVYQRNYDWGRKQCRRLWDDIVSIIGVDGYHFFGSVVHKYDSMREHVVIDGQQRLTTVSLLLMAMHKLGSEGEKECDDDMLGKIKSLYCFSRNGGLYPKIRHVDRDKEAYTAVLRGDSDGYDRKHNATRNYNNFVAWVRECQYGIGEIFDAVERLQIVDVELGQNDNPQLIFESLNSTGLALTDGDKIRNFILMNLADGDQGEYYRKYWKDIERNSNYTCSEKDGRTAVTRFVRDFLTVRTADVPRMEDVYPKFKDYYRKRAVEGKTAEDLLAEMKAFSRYLWEVENGETGHACIDRVLKRIALLQFTVCHPFLLNLLNALRVGDITEKDMEGAVRLTENYLLRRVVCNAQSYAQNKIFESLYRVARQSAEKDGVGMVDALVAHLTSKAVSGRFPDDGEFAKNLMWRNIYGLNANKRTYILHMFNGGYSKEGDTSVVAKLRSKQLSVEHIMPQKLTAEWKKALGPEAEIVHRRWLNTIANLTLTAYNGTFGNRNFLHKLRDAEDDAGNKVGFSVSPLPINDYVKRQVEWTEKQLEERQGLMVKAAIEEIWPYPQTEYRISEGSYEELSLEAAPEDFTGTLCISCTISGKAVSMEEGDSWKNIVKAIVRRLDKVYHEALLDMAGEPEGLELKDSGVKYGYEEVVPGVFFCVDSSTDVKIRRLAEICSRIGIGLSEVVFQVQYKKGAWRKPKAKLPTLPF